MPFPPTRHERTVLAGRGTECATLDQLLAEAYLGRSSVMVLRGEPGIGKTALLDYAAERGEGCRVLRAVGAEWEMELPFAGLHQLCVGLLDGRERLPAPQRDALATAFGLSSGAQPDRFLVGLGVLSLLSDAADEHPVVCLVDDVQWLDRSSAQVLAFVARRLAAESVVLLFAEREVGGLKELAGLPALQLGGLPDASARELLGSVIAAPLDARVRERILAETHGNPLALLELPRGSSPRTLAGGFGLPGDGSVPGRIEASFRRRVEQLPATTQRLLLVAAADPTGEPALLIRAADELGLSTEELAPAEADGLVELGLQVAFRHSLLRSAIYGAAPSESRRAAHRVLAAATDAVLDPDRRAWHRAHATVGPDEDVAGELERSAGRASARGGLAAAAAFLERAAALTADPGKRARRALEAAATKLLAGDAHSALTLLATATAGPLDEVDRAMLQRLHGQILLDLRRAAEALPLLVGAARRLESIDPGLARDIHLEAVRAASVAGRLGPGMLDAARAARTAPPRLGGPIPVDLLLDGLAVRFTDGYAASAPALKRALRAIRDEGEREGQSVRWPWLARRVAPDLFADDTWDAIATRGVQLARENGALAVLPLALNNLANLRCLEGDLDSTAALLDEADAIATSIGVEPLVFGRLSLAGFRGNEAEALVLFDAIEPAAIARGEGVVLTFCEHARAVLYNGLGRYEAALDPAQSAAERDELLVSVWSLPELVEAATRCGQIAVANGAVERLSERTAAAGTELALGIEARSRALLSDRTLADRLYREAIDRLGRSRVALELARARLLYGEWLRRDRRRVDARDQLRRAQDMFTSMGAEAFAARAGRELLATGETARKRTDEARDDLTAQELQIAHLARDGLSNAEIGARLFISPRTVEYHLHKVFTKLGIASREHLDRMLPGG
ncbi:MAG TPA: AAA family ATPase [Solirubrobacteraceae bacterium]|nr:AAA family ATPase [Solirubrobacteraceae bacterium]